MANNYWFASLLLYFWCTYYIFHCVVFSYSLIKENIIDIYFDRREEDLTGFVDFDFIEDEAEILNEEQIRLSIEKINNHKKKLNKKINKKINIPVYKSNVKFSMPKIQMSTIKKPKYKKINNIILETIEDDSDDDVNMSILYNGDNNNNYVSYSE